MLLQARRASPPLSWAPFEVLLRQPPSSHLLLEQLFYVHLYQGVARISLVEIWNGDLLHVSLGDIQGVNYVAVTGQSYL